MIQDQTMKKMIRLGDLHDGIYLFKKLKIGSSCVVAQKDSSKLWHSRMGHLSTQALKQISHMLKCNFFLNKNECCDVCHRSKQSRLVVLS
uniref:GAG-pre-integrase domain-containing protein n=2 Tax=Cajanus cajan TaxID=3821 RepID=A0A151RGN6_CAJCA|nr:hypothetical protein KK1_036999 [Cajanus cajan]